MYQRKWITMWFLLAIRSIADIDVMHDWGKSTHTRVMRAIGNFKEKRKNTMKYYVKNGMLYEMESETPRDDAIIPDEAMQISAGFKYRGGTIRSINTNNVLIVPEEAFDESSFAKVPGEYRGIESIVFGSAINTIGVHAFRDCRNLREVVFPRENRELTIHPFAFKGCAIKDLRIRNPKRLYKYSLSNMEIDHLTIENPSRIGPKFLADSKIGRLTITSCLALLTPDIFKGAEIGEIEAMDCPSFNLVLWKKYAEEMHIRFIETESSCSADGMHLRSKENKMLEYYFKVLLSKNFQEVYGLIGPFDSIARNAINLMEKENVTHSELMEIMRYEPYAFMDDEESFEESLENGSLRELLNDLV